MLITLKNSGVLGEVDRIESKFLYITNRSIVILKSVCRKGGARLKKTHD